MFCYHPAKLRILLNYYKVAEWRVYMEDCELIFLISTIACSIIKCCPEDDISILAAAFTQLGDTLATLLAQKEVRENRMKEKAEKENPCLDI